MAGRVWEHSVPSPWLPAPLDPVTGGAGGFSRKRTSWGMDSRLLRPLPSLPGSPKSRTWPRSLSASDEAPPEELSREASCRPWLGSGQPRGPGTDATPVLPRVSSRVSCSDWEGVWRHIVLIPPLTCLFRVSSHPPLHLLLKEGIQGLFPLLKPFRVAPGGATRACNPGQAENGATPCPVSRGTVLLVPLLLVLLSGGRAGVRTTRDSATHTRSFSVFFSAMVYLRILNVAPCALQQDLVVYPSWMWHLFAPSNPKLPVHPSPPAPHLLATILS